jgi:hypothetical protein
MTSQNNNAKALGAVIRLRVARTLGLTVATLAGILAVVGGVACRAGTDAQAPGAAQNAGAPADTPILVSCSAGEQALIRQVEVNGRHASQVECVPVDAQASWVSAPHGAASDVPAPAATGYQAGPSQAEPPQLYPPRNTAAAPPVAHGAEVAPAASPRPVAYEPVTPAVVEPRVVYEEPAVAKRSKRSWKKSAVIIGGSTAIGAGVGGATGGKKGALIGAAVGGGGAAIWDAVTRSR